MTTGFESGPSLFPELPALADDILTQLVTVQGFDRDDVTVRKLSDQIRIFSDALTEEHYLAVVNFVRQFDTKTPISYNVDTQEIILGLNGPLSYFPPAPTQH